MLDDAQLLATWNTMNAAFNRGDLDEFGSYLADDFFGGAMNATMDKTQFIAAGKAGRAERGWTGQHTVTASARSNVLVTLYYNTFADGSRTEGGGLLLFGDDGKVHAIRALNASGSPMVG